MNITEFLEARITEDEAHANAAKDWVANGPNPDFSWFGSPGEYVGPHRFGVASSHIAAMSPARVLAECAAKRAIVAEHHPDRQLENWYWLQRKCAECGGTWHKWLNNDVPTDIGPEQGCRTLRHLAAVYASHPDYQQEWAVA